MEKSFITEADRDESLECLLNSSREIGNARGNMRLMEGKVKIAEAEGMMMSQAKQVEMKRADARSSTEYCEAVSNLAHWEGIYEGLKRLAEAHHARLDAFRTQQSDHRGLDTRM